MNIVTIGGGRVGLPVATGFAQLGHETTCYEWNVERRALIKLGRAPFAEAGLDDALAVVVNKGMLRVCDGIKEAVANADVVFIAVPVGVGSSGTKGLWSATEAAAKYAPNDCVIAIKSTVPPGTCAKIKSALGGKIKIVANPEFLRQGKGLFDFLSPMRVVVGADGQHEQAVMREAYAPLINRGVKYIETDIVSAEVAKLAANMFLSSRAALINEIADLCECAGGGMEKVTEVLKADRRIGESFLRAGPGFGGTCLPKDGRMLIGAARRNGVGMPAVKGVYKSNKIRPARIARRIAGMLPPHPTIAVLGFAYKPGADNICESAAVSVVEYLREHGAQINGSDAGLSSAMRTTIGDVSWFEEPLDALANADALVALNDDNVFSRLSADEIKSAMKGVTVFDYAGAFCRHEMKKTGLSFYPVGNG